MRDLVEELRMASVEPQGIMLKHPLVRPVEAVILSGAVLICIGIIVVVQVLHGIAHDQKASIERGYKNRAVICDLAKGLGVAEPQGCADPAIQPYRDPYMTEGSTAGARASKQAIELLCVYLTRDHQPLPPAAAKLCP